MHDGVGPIAESIAQALCDQAVPPAGYNTGSSRPLALNKLIYRLPVGTFPNVRGTVSIEVVHGQFSRWIVVRDWPDGDGRPHQVRPSELWPHRDSTQVRIERSWGAEWDEQHRNVPPEERFAKVERRVLGTLAALARDHGLSIDHYAKRR